MTPAKYEAGRRLNELENRMKIIDESITKTEDMLISARQVQAMTRQQLIEQRRAVAAMPDGDV